MHVADLLFQQRSICFVTQQEEVRTWIEWTVTGIEALAVIIVIISILVATSRFLFTRHRQGRFTLYRHNVGRALLLVLEILIAADIVHTVALSPTLTSVGVLGLLVIVRTILNWSLVVDIEGRWPWQSAKETTTDRSGPLKP